MVFLLCNRIEIQSKTAILVRLQNYAVIKNQEINLLVPYHAYFTFWLQIKGRVIDHGQVNKANQVNLVDIQRSMLTEGTECAKGFQKLHENGIEGCCSFCVNCLEELVHLSVLGWQL